MKNADAKYAALSQINPDSVAYASPAPVQLQPQSQNDQRKLIIKKPNEPLLRQNSVDNRDRQQLLNAANNSLSVAAAASRSRESVHTIQLNNSSTNLAAAAANNSNNKLSGNKNENGPRSSISKPRTLRSRLEKFKFLSRSSDDLIKLDASGGGGGGGGGEESGGERGEEARLAEEALAANLKLIRKQKAKFLRLQRILSRNVFIIPMCVVFTILSSVSIFGATLSDHFESMSYNITELTRLVEQSNGRSLEMINAATRLNLTLADVESGVARSLLLAASLDNTTNNGHRAAEQDASSPVNTAPPTYMSMLTERYQAIYFYEVTSPSSEYHEVARTSFLAAEDSPSIKKNLLYDTHSGVWRSCNFLNNVTRQGLGNLDECVMYKKANIELSVYSDFANDEESDPRRDLIRMHNAAACCTIVCYLLLVATWITSVTSAITRKVPPTLASSVLNSIIVVFNLLLVAIFHRKIASEERRADCFDLKILFDVVCSSRVVHYGYSLGLAWLALLLTALNTVCWFHIAKMQKMLFSNGYYF